ncbi:MAG: CBS domain-containing protein [Candidatus Omnitrophica bacterium]|nr:CBS domain-containing protein [Candidatus Omnitrophota bacterium]
MDRPLVADVYKLHGDATISIPADSSLEDVIGTLIREPSLRGIFLVNSKQRLVGMVTRLDLIRWAHLNLTGGKGRHEIPISELFRIVDARKAKDLASGDPHVLAVRENDTLQAALDKMLDYEEDVIPVLDSEGKVSGDLRLSEVLWWVLAFGRRATQK